MTPSLLTTYKTDIAPKLVAALGLKNTMQAPRIEKVIVNVGYGRHVKENAYIENVEATLARITGQKAVHHKAKKSISNFKIREGLAIGASVTLRGPRMYDFLYRLIHIVLPRVRDFRGIPPNAFDRQGNYTIGFKESGAFPEANVDSPDKAHGLEVIIATTAKNKEEGRLLLETLGFPFKAK